MSRSGSQTINFFQKTAKTGKFSFPQEKPIPKWYFWEFFLTFLAFAFYQGILTSKLIFYGVRWDFKESLTNFFLVFIIVCSVVFSPHSDVAGSFFFPLPFCCSKAAKSYQQTCLWGTRPSRTPNKIRTILQSRVVDTKLMNPNNFDKSSKACAKKGKLGTQKRASS